MGRSSVLLIYTGGTIGMKTDPVTGTLVPFDFNGIYDEFPSLRRLDVDLEVLPFEPIDSSNVAPELWVRLADIIRENYERYDGFVVLHGTDTMSYSSSALSFMLENLGKPVVFTGSQIPIGVLRTDGRENLITAIEIAAAKEEGAGHCTRGIALFPEQAVPGEPDEKAQRRGAQRVRFAQLSRSPTWAWASTTVTAQYAAATPGRLSR